MPAPSTLFEQLVDYAGLFPPASVSMAEAVRNYSEYRRGRDAGMLGRFVVPVSRLDEYATQRGGVDDATPWPVSAIAGTDLSDDARTIMAFNARNGRSRIESVEVRLAHPSQAAFARAAFTREMEVWMEAPPGTQPKILAASVRSAGCGAKIRMGGVTSSAFPSASDVAGFLHACHAVGATAKATAGLHHPLRGEYGLTYEPETARATMFGFLNVFLAATLVCLGGGPEPVAALLEERSPAAFSANPDGVRWRDHTLTAQAIGTARRRLCRSFGSCSFEEPAAGLRDISWL